MVSSSRRISPDLPWKGLPIFSSAWPGASPITMTFAFLGPSPAIQTVPLVVSHRSQRLHLGFREGIGVKTEVMLAEDQSVLEISRIVEADGGKKLTVFDNAGIGDLYTT